MKHFVLKIIEIILYFKNYKNILNYFFKNEQINMTKNYLIMSILHLKINDM